MKPCEKCNRCGVMAVDFDYENIEVDGPHPGCSEWAEPELWPVPVCRSCVQLRDAEDEGCMTLPKFYAGDRVVTPFGIGNIIAMVGDCYYVRLDSGSDAIAATMEFDVSELSLSEEELDANEPYFKD